MLILLREQLQLIAGSCGSYSLVHLDVENIRSCYLGCIHPLRGWVHVKAVFCWNNLTTLHFHVEMVLRFHEPRAFDDVLDVITLDVTKLFKWYYFIRQMNLIRSYSTFLHALFPNYTGNSLRNLVLEIPPAKTWILTSPTSNHRGLFFNPIFSVAIQHVKNVQQRFGFRWAIEDFDFASSFRC